MSATLDAQPLARLLDDAPIIAAEARSFEVRRTTSPRRAELSLELQTAQVLRARPRAAMTATSCAFCRAPRKSAACNGTLEESNLGSGVSRAAAVRRARRGARRMRRCARAARSAQDRAGDQHRRNQPHHRRHSCRRRLGPAPLCGVRSRHRHEPARDGQGIAGRRRPAARPRRPPRAPGVCYRLWSEGVQASLVPHTRRPRSCTRISRRSRSSSPAGARADAARACAGSIRRPPAPLAQARDLLRALGAIDAAGRITRAWPRSGAAGRSPATRAHADQGPRLGAPRLACDLAAILASATCCAPRPAHAMRICACASAPLRGAGALPRGLTVDSRALRKAAAQRGELAARVGGGARRRRIRDEWTGVLVALAYPDRMAVRASGDGRYLLANGRGARFARAASARQIRVHRRGRTRRRRARGAHLLGRSDRRADLERHFGAQIEDRSRDRLG